MNIDINVSSDIKKQNDANNCRDKFKLSSKQKGTKFNQEKYLTITMVKEPFKSVSFPKFIDMTIINIEETFFKLTAEQD